MSTPLRPITEAATKPHLSPVSPPPFGPPKRLPPLFHGAPRHDFDSEIYDHLRRIAARISGERRGFDGHNTLGPTALVHEAWLKLSGRRDFESRAHLVRTAAMAMRQVLVDQARQRACDKRGGGLIRTTLSALAAPGGGVDLVDLDDALSQLERLDAEAADVVVLRCFAGMTHPEIAEVLGLSARTVDTRWRHARAWLLVALGHGIGDR